MSDQEQTQLLLIKGALSDFDRDKSDMVEEAFKDLREKYTKEKYGSDEMEIILGLVVSKWVIEKSMDK